MSDPLISIFLLIRNSQHFVSILKVNREGVRARVDDTPTYLTRPGALVVPGRYAGTGGKPGLRSNSSDIRWGGGGGVVCADNGLNVAFYRPLFGFILAGVGGQAHVVRRPQVHGDAHPRPDALLQADLAGVPVHGTVLYYTVDCTV